MEDVMTQANKPKLIQCSIAIFAMLWIANPVWSAEHDYFVHYSTFAPFPGEYNAGDITQDDQYDVPLIPADDACGMVFENVGHYAWVAESGQIIESHTIYDDITVFAPYPGCGGGPVEAYLDNNPLNLPGSVNSLRLGDVSGAYWIDSSGDKIIPDSCGSCVAGEGYAIETNHPEWDVMLGNIYAVQSGLIHPKTRNIRYLLPQALDDVTNLELKIRYQINRRRTIDYDRLESTIRSLEDSSLKKLSAAKGLLNSCKKNWIAGRTENAYIACDQATIELNKAQSRLDLAGSVTR